MNLFSKRPLLCALTSFTVTAFFSSLLFYRRSALFILVLFLSLFVIILLFRLRSKRKTLREIRGKESVALCCLFLAFLAAFSQLLFSCTQLKVPKRFLDERVEIRAVVRETVYEGEGYAILKAKALEINGEKSNIKLRFELYTEESFRVGDTFYCTGKIKDLLLHSRAEASQLFSSGCAGAVSSVSELTKEKPQSSPLVWISRLGDLITNKIEGSISGDSGPLISALLLGRTDSLDKHITLDFKRLGITHMLALSGMHLTTLMSFIYMILARTNLKKRTKSLIIIALTLFYVTLSGFCLSILRAAFMFLFASLSFFTRRENDSFTSLFLAITVIFLISPNAVTDIGLWLSFFGTLSIISYLQLKDKNEGAKKRSLIRSAVSYFSVSFIISIFAMMFTLPISAFVFGELSLISPISNVIFAFLFDCLLILAFLSPFLCGIRLFCLVCEILGNAIIGLSRFLSSMDMIFLSVSYVPFYLALSLLLTCLAVILCLKMRKRHIFITLLSSFTILMLTLSVCVFVNFKSDTFIYERGSSSQRNEFLFFTNSAKTTVIDISNETKGSFSEMMERCEREHISEISCYVISRYNESLCKSLDLATSKIKMKRILLPEPMSESDLTIANAVKERLEKLKIPYAFYNSGEEFPLKSISLKIVHADSHVDNGSYFIEIVSGQKTFCYVSSAAFVYDGLPLGDNLDYLILGHHDGVFIAYFKMPRNVKNLIIADSKTPYAPDFLESFYTPKNVFMDKSVKIKIK